MSGPERPDGARRAQNAADPDGYYSPMIAPPEAVAAKLPHLPESPGVYLWKYAEGTVL